MSDHFKDTNFHNLQSCYIENLDILHNALVRQIHPTLFRQIHPTLLVLWMFSSLSICVLHTNYIQYKGETWFFLPSSSVHLQYIYLLISGVLLVLSFTFNLLSFSKLSSQLTSTMHFTSDTFYLKDQYRAKALVLGNLVEVYINS